MAQKLYTKEMFLQAAEKCEVSMIDAKHIMQYIDEYVTPIELPSDEEIEKQYDHAFLYGKLYAEQNYTYTLEELTKMAEEVWEGCHGCDDNDKNFWINGFITGMNYKKIN